MRRSLFTLGISLILFSPLLAQQPTSERQRLIEKVTALYQKGNLEKAIQAGEQLVKVEKTGGDPVSYVNALINLGRIKREYYVSLQNKLTLKKVDASEINETRAKAEQTADDAELLFRMALELNERFGKGQTPQTADIKRDLAWVVSNHLSSSKRNLGGSRSRIDEAAKLYNESIEISEQSRGKDADETLFIVLDAGDFYYKYVGFQKALALYERFIQNYEQKHGASDPELVRALRPYASILHTIFLDQESLAAVKRIEAITKKKEPLPKAEIDLHLRSKESVAYLAPIVMKLNQQTADFRHKLKAEGKTLNFGNLSSMPKLISIPVNIETDENGKIVKAVAGTFDRKLGAEAEAAVSMWTVSPITYNGKPTRMRGILNYKKAP